MDWSVRISRNRQFDACETPAGRARLRSERILRSLSSEILESRGNGRVSAWPSGSAGGYAVRLELDRPPLRYSRTTYLTEGEFSALKSAPSVTEILESGLKRFPAR